MAKLLLTSSTTSFRLFSVLVLAFSFAVSSSRAYAQIGGPCVDTASIAAQDYRNAYRAFASGSSAHQVQARTLSGIPTVLPSQVKLVADTTVCRAASIALDARIQDPRPTTPVIVLEIGTTRRMVIKDTGMPGRRENMLFDQIFSTLFEVIAF